MLHVVHTLFNTSISVYPSTVDTVHPLLLIVQQKTGIWLARTAIFDHFAMAHWCGMDGLLVCHGSLVKDHLLVGPLAVSALCFANCQETDVVS